MLSHFSCQNKGVIIITKLISLDTSSSKSGYAIFENAVYKKSGVINLDTYECKKKYKGNSDKRIKDMCLAIIELLKEERPDIIVIEKLNVGRNMISVRTLSKIIGAAYCYSILNDCFYYEIQATQWRSKLGMQSSKRKRDEYKALAVKFIKNNLNLDVTDDEADAICAGIGYIKMFVHKDVEMEMSEYIPNNHYCPECNTKMKRDISSMTCGTFVDKTSGFYKKVTT